MPSEQNARPSVPSFVMSRHGRSVAAYGCRTPLASTELASRAAAERLPVVGAVGFDATSLAALWVPEHLDTAATAIASTIPGTAPARRRATRIEDPPPHEHRRRVEDVIETIRAGAADKVVLARSMTLRFDEPLDPYRLISDFAAGNPAGDAFGVDLSAGTDRFAGHWLIGSSPELLVRKQGRQISCYPFAGSAPRSSDQHTDAAAADRLLASGKDRAEHAFVVDYLRTALGPWCSDLDVPSEPKLLSTKEMWHLATPIVGTVATESTTVLDVALSLTPTPAVGGTPTRAAQRIIAEIEGDTRDFYGGALGWCDHNGDGEWLVAIRCVELAANRREVRTWAGGGIVADSDPQAELDETTAKFGTALRALGVI